MDCHSAKTKTKKNHTNRDLGQAMNWRHNKANIVHAAVILTGPIIVACQWNTEREFESKLAQEKL